jgi:gamma-glutamyl-gamma-aminobutyrate hydrolase PuuD
LSWRPSVFYLGRDYSEAIQAAGGVPVHIPLIPDRDYISSVMDGLDGILLPDAIVMLIHRIMGKTRIRSSDVLFPKKTRPIF